ncbi:MAG: hypothetical protein ACREOZ_03565, partial [Gloeomargaritales cyanobacterium]
METGINAVHQPSQIITEQQSSPNIISGQQSGLETEQQSLELSLVIKKRTMAHILKERSAVPNHQFDEDMPLGP